MKQSTKKAILLGAAAAFAASLIPYELKKEENGDFSFTSLLLGVYSRHSVDGEKHVTVSIGNAPCFTKESRRRRDAALRHAAEVAAEKAMFADEDDPHEGACPVETQMTEIAPVAESEEAPAEEVPAEELMEEMPEAAQEE